MEQQIRQKAGLVVYEREEKKGLALVVMTLWQIGLVIFILAGAINAVLVNFDVGGLPRELARLSILTGLVILLMGLIKRKK